MFNKYHGRSISTISRDNSPIEVSSKEPSWFNDFVSNLEKNSVQTKKELSTFEQINQILGNKSKYSTVEEAVMDMQKRTGLYDYLRTKSAQEHKEHALFDTIPELKTYIDNFVKDRPGVSVDAVVHDILRYPPIKEKLPNSDDVPSDIKEYINGQILEAKKSHSHSGEDLNIGKMDLSTDENTAKDNDPFGGCTPHKEGL
jgi:superfamily I DNA/RNA helicase